MSTEFHLRVQHVLERVSRAEPAAREQLVRAACGDDENLLREVLSLLPHYEQVSTYEPKGLVTSWKLPGTTTFLKVRAEVDAEPDAELKPPFWIDRYTVVALLGRGGMGVVYRAVQPMLHTDVALKLLRRRLVSTHDRWRFTFEEEILRQLRHPGIARFIHSGFAVLRRPDRAVAMEDEQPYFVMEYVPGRSLTKYASACALDVRARLGLLVKVCEAVEYAHQRGIVHCDLKPDNILVGESGQPKIVDFGIARIAAFEGAEAAAQRGAAGTLAYASPEQLVGRAEQLAPAADVYALGIITHELVTGKLPTWEGEAPRLRLQSVCVEPRLRPDAPVNREFRYYLQGILATALRQTRGDPYRTAGELGADLENLLAQYPVETGWRAFKNRMVRRLVGSSWGASSASRPLSAVLRKRIGMAVEANSERGE